MTRHFIFTTFLTLTLIIALSGCASSADTKPASNGADLGGFVPVHASQTVEMPSAPTPASPPASALSDSFLSRFQDRLNVFASPAFLQHVQEANAIDQSPIFVNCTTALVEIGADVRDKPLVVLQAVNTAAIPPGCAACFVAAQHKNAEDAASGSLLARIAEARSRTRLIVRRGIVGCAPLATEMRLQALTPEGQAAAFITILETLFGKYSGDAQ